MKVGLIRMQGPGYKKIVGSGCGIKDKHLGSATLQNLKCFNLEIYRVPVLYDFSIYRCPVLYKVRE
jgi:hypothetical protein